MYKSNGSCGPVAQQSFAYEMRQAPWTEIWAVSPDFEVFQKIAESCKVLKTQESEPFEASLRIRDSPKPKRKWVPTTQKRLDTKVHLGDEFYEILLYA